MDALSQAKPALEEDRVLLGAEPGASSAERSADGSVRGSQRFRVVLLPEARADARGLFYQRGGLLFFLPWTRICAGHAAEVGEPEGVQTVVFDLTLSGRPGERCRLDADPGQPARELGEAISRGIGRERCTPSLRAVALEGYATRSYPDLESFESDSPPLPSRST